MRVAVVHTEGSPCRCHEAIAGALSRGGHEPVILDAEDFLRRGGGAVEGIRVAFDHTDTVGGKGRRRNEPRRLLEKLGIEVAGSTAQACESADDKARMRKALDGDENLPRGVILCGDEDPRQQFVPWPRVLKVPCEHMSRGVVYVGSPEDQLRELERLFEEFGPPIIAEEYIRGQEVTATVFEREEGGELLMSPVLEWPVRGDLFTHEEKMDPSFVPSLARLSEYAGWEVQVTACYAFRFLRLRGYARMDLRVNRNGEAFLLEVNPRPSLETDGPTAVAEQLAGRTLDAFILHVLSLAVTRADRR